MGMLPLIYARNTRGFATTGALVLNVSPIAEFVTKLQQSTWPHSGTSYKWTYRPTEGTLLTLPIIKKDRGGDKGEKSLQK